MPGDQGQEQQQSQIGDADLEGIRLQVRSLFARRRTSLAEAQTSAMPELGEVAQ
jgi:hypothetical protein